MPRSSSISTIQKNKRNAQYIVTIPKPLAEGMRMEQGTKIRWEIKGTGKLQMEIITNQ